MRSDYQIVERVLIYLENNFRLQPTLEELAAGVQLSPFHLQRLFRRWVGISPKRFLQFLTLEYAKRLLEESSSILDAAYDSGLSGPGRMHDLFVSLEAVTPGEFKWKGQGLTLFSGFHQGPFGKYLLAATERGICHLSFVVKGAVEENVHLLRKKWPEATIVEDPKRTRLYADQIFDESLQRQNRRIPLVLKGTNFQIKVWEALLRIPPGFLASYEQIAQFIGQPRAVRAVGNAVASNPVAYLIPCHRVIRKMGHWGNYQWQSSRKKAMIGWEAAHKQS